MPVKYLLVAIVFAFTLLAIAPVSSQAAQYYSALAIESEDELTIEDMERIAAWGIVRGELEDARSAMVRLIRAEPGLEHKYAPLLSYAEFLMGEKMQAVSRLEDTDSITASLMLASFGGGEVAIPGRDDKATEVSPFFYSIERRNGGLGLGLFPKSGEDVALKKAFYELVPDPTLEQIEKFNEMILSDKRPYFLGGDVLWEGESHTLCLAFVDLGRMSKSLVIDNKAHENLKLGVITQEGSEITRERLVEEFGAVGYDVEDFGRGKFYQLGDSADSVALVIEISEEVSSSQSRLSENFKNVEGTITMTLYNTVTGKSVGVVTEHSSVVDIDERSGGARAVKTAYKKASRELASLIDGVAENVKWSPGGIQPITMNIASSDVFSSNYKYYADNPFGEITLTNNTGRDFGSVKFTFAIKEYVDYPSEIDVGTLASQKSVNKGLVAVFNSKIVDITDDSFLQSEIKVTYYDQGEEKTVATTHPVYVYEKHALVWDDKGKVASFITPKDPVVVGFSDAATSSLGGGDFFFNRNIEKARAVFAAMGVLGLSYMEDPNNPYEVVSGLTSVVDYVQFPRETLQRRVGDCDDLTSLYVSSLESLGIRTKLLDAPGHIFMAFDTGVSKSDLDYLGLPSERVITFDDRIWLPVETTLVGSSFTNAWKKGAENYVSESEDIKVIDVNDASRLFKAPNLPPKSFETKFSAEDIEKFFPNEMEQLAKERLEYLEAKLTEKGDEGLSKLMVVYGQEGMLDKAMEIGLMIEDKERDAVVLNNLGNLYYLNGSYEDALGFYDKAARLAPEDVGILMNMARAYIKSGSKADAKRVFEKAASMEPSVRNNYIDIYMEVGL